MKALGIFAILFLIVGSVSFCGCTSSDDNSTGDSTTETGVSTVEASSTSSGDTEVKPAGSKAEELDATVKPILESVLGDLVLVESGTITNQQGHSATYLKYKSHVSLDGDSATTISNKLEDMGWKVTANMVSSEGTVLMFNKDNEYLSISENADEKGYIYVQEWEGD